MTTRTKTNSRSTPLIGTVLNNGPLSGLLRLLRSIIPCRVTKALKTRSRHQVLSPLPRRANRPRATSVIRVLTPLTNAIGVRRRQRVHHLFQLGRGVVRTADFITCGGNLFRRDTYSFTPWSTSVLPQDPYSIGGKGKISIQGTKRQLLFCVERGGSGVVTQRELTFSCTRQSPTQCLQSPPTHPRRSTPVPAEKGAPLCEYS